jgi:Protein tyrosine and serine/threonine kinase
VLAETTPRELFQREVAIWARLQHPHVLQLCGASSATGDPPWFFVSPYEKHGSLVQYLKEVAMEWDAGDGTVAGGIDVSGGGKPSKGLGVRNLSVSPSPGKGRATIPVSASPSRDPQRGYPLGGKLGSAGTGDDGPVPREWDLYRFMYEIAKGMEYLHSNDLVHGDLKVGLSLVIRGRLT